MTAKGSNRLDAFDTLRGLAALAVLGHHLRLGFDPAGTMIWFGQGFLAVDLFFLLSGYVMARTYEPAFAGGAGALAFLRARFERLYPMLLLGGLLGVLLFGYYRADGLIVPANLDWPRALAGQFLLIPFLASGGVFVFNNVQWSIVYELIANALHALGWRMLRVPTLLLIAALSLAALMAVASFGGSLSLGWSRATFALGFARVGFSYSLGVVLFRTAPRWQPLLPQVPAWILGAASVVLLALPELPLGNRLLGWIQIATVLALVAIVMLATTARANHASARWLGEMSYPLYAIHTPLLALVHALIVWAGLEGSWAGRLALLAGCAGIAVLAEGVGRRIEQPLMAWRASGPAQTALREARERYRAAS